MRTLLIDGDVVAYKAAASAEERLKWPNGEVTIRQTSEDTEAWARARDELAGYAEKAKADALIVCLTDSEGNFRKKLDPSYKRKRSLVPKPILLPFIRQNLLDHYDTYLRPGLEGDDCMGILATHPKLVKGEKIIVSIDKDMLGIPGFVWNPDKHPKPVQVSEQAADHWHLMQTLTGDTTDEYPGCPGIGPVKARIILAGADEFSVTDAWPRVVAAFESKGLTEEHALLQARLARILRHVDYDYKRKEPILWSPTRSVSSSSASRSRSSGKPERPPRTTQGKPGSLPRNSTSAKTTASRPSATPSSTK